MSGFGSFSPEAYQQLQEAYAAQLTAADESESAGVTVAGEKFSVETESAPSPWLEKTGLWQYPSGKGDHLDVQQKQQDLLAALRNEDGELVIENDQDESDDSLDGLSEDELNALIDRILSEEDEGEEEEEDEAKVEAEAEIEIEAEVDEDSEKDEELTDAQLDTLIDELFSDDEGDSEDDTEDEPPGKTAEEIASEIEALKAELAEISEDVEETDVDDDQEPDEEEISE
jgi:hypothetical protein